MAKPGSIPEKSTVVPPEVQAASSCLAIDSFIGEMWVRATREVATTFLPDSRMRQMSASASVGRRSPDAV